MAFHLHCQIAHSFLLWWFTKIQWFRQDLIAEPVTLLLQIFVVFVREVLWICTRQWFKRVTTCVLGLNAEKCCETWNNFLCSHTDTCRVLPLDRILWGPSELTGWLSLNQVILGAGFPSTWHSSWVVLLTKTVTSSGKSLSVPLMVGGTVRSRE